MYKNVQVNHSNNATNTTTTTTTTPFSSSSPSSSFPSQPNQTATSLPVQITSASSFSSSAPIIHPPSLHTSNIGISKISDGGISLPVSFDSSNKNMSLSQQSSKLKSDVDQLDDLVKDLLIEVNRPIGTHTNNRSSNNTNNKYSTSSSHHRRSNNDNNETLHSKLPSSIRASSYTQASTLNNQKHNDFDANTVSGLIDGSSLSSNSGQREEQRSKTTREERIRIKRGVGGTEIPIRSSSSMTTTTTTTNKPAQTSTSRDHLSVDEQLIDSLLESVQNTLRKRSQQQQTHQPAWTTDIPIHHQHPANNRRTYSSSAAYTDSVHRVSK